METKRTRGDAAHRYLTIEVEHEIYAIPILKVKEILGMKEITPLPQTPASVKGVLNLRGRIIPVVDLRVKFGLLSHPPTKTTSIVVLDLVSEKEQLLLGIVVDTVQEVQVILEDKISQLAGLETRVKARYIKSVADTPEGIRILLDVDKILTEDDLAVLDQVPEKQLA